MSKPFGKFPSFDAFLESYKSAALKVEAEAQEGLDLESRRRQMRSARQVAEVDATVRAVEDDGSLGGHVQMTMGVDRLEEADVGVSDDVQRAIDEGEDVFLAVRVGDAMGIREPIEGLVEGVGLAIRGEWIPAEHAYAHGGRKIPVLHFTHHPLGFICVAEPAKCYR
jgi:endonuclease G